MKKYFLGLIAIAFCSCAPSSYNLTNTVWYNVTSGELDGVEGNVFTSIYFLEDNQMCVNTSVECNNEMIVSPTITALGSYHYEGTLKKGIRLTISKTDTWGNTTSNRGIITPNGLFLMETDSIARVYNKATNLTVKQK